MPKNNLCIITTSLNEEKEISHHIDYLNKLSNKYGIRYVIVDGGSNDDTIPIIQSKYDRKNIFISNNFSIYQAWNEGINHVCKDNYICFLGIGDRLSDFYIKDLLLIISQHRYDVLFTQLDGKKNQKLKFKVNSSIMNWTCLPFPHAGSFFHKDLFEKNGKFDEEYKIAGDLEWLLRLNYNARIKKKNIKYKYIENGYVYMRPGGISTGKGKFMSTLIQETFKAHFSHKTPISIKRILYFLVMYLRNQLS